MFVLRMCCLHAGQPTAFSPRSPSCRGLTLAAETRDRKTRYTEADSTHTQAHRRAMYHETVFTLSRGTKKLFIACLPSRVPVNGSLVYMLSRGRRPRPPSAPCSASTTAAPDTQTLLVSVAASMYQGLAAVTHRSKEGERAAIGAAQTTPNLPSVSPCTESKMRVGGAATTKLHNLRNSYATVRFLCIKLPRNLEII